MFLYDKVTKNELLYKLVTKICLFGKTLLPLQYEKKLVHRVSPIYYNFSKL